MTVMLSNLSNKLNIKRRETEIRELSRRVTTIASHKILHLVSRSTKFVHRRNAVCLRYFFLFLHPNPRKRRHGRPKRDEQFIAMDSKGESGIGHANPPHIEPDPWHDIKPDSKLHYMWLHASVSYLFIWLEFTTPQRKQSSHRALFKIQIRCWNASRSPFVIRFSTAHGELVTPSATM